MKKLTYLKHLILLNLIIVFVLTEEMLSVYYLIPVFLLFINHVYFQYLKESNFHRFEKKKLKRAFLVEKITSLNSIFFTSIMIMLSFSTIVINRNFGLFISAYSFIGLIIFSDYHQIADFAYYRMDDQVIMDFDERALRKSKPFYILPYYLIIIGFVYLMYFYGIMGDVDLILFITLSIATIPFFLKGPRRAKANIKKKMYYTYDDISIPMQVVEPVKYKMVIFVMLGAMYLLLFLTPKVDYIVNLIIIAIVSLHSYLFSEFDIVLLYYFNEEGQIVKEY